jgi:hypothetical protein
MQKNEMGGPCSTYEARRDAYKVLVWRPEVENYLEDGDIDRRIIFRWVFRKWDGRRLGLD